jgi:peptidyl-prolyl cis-trans isomerase D
MMETMRRAAKGWTAKILIGLLVISFAVWGIADVFRGFTGGTLVTVGSQEISSEQFAETYRQTLQNYSRQIGENITPERARELGLDRQILNEMIRSAAVMSEARDLNLAVGDAQIAADLARNPNFTDAQGNFNADLVKNFLQRTGQSEAAFLASEREQLIRSAIGDTAQAGVVLPNALVEAASRYANEQRDARYFVVKATPSEVQQPTEEDIKKHHEANTARYTAPEYRSLALVVANPVELAQSISISDEELNAGYEKYKSDYFKPEVRTLLQTTFPSVEEARKARDRIAAGEDFLAIAKERGFSETEATWADRTVNDIPDPAIASAAFELKEGEVSEPVEGQLAVMLLKAVKVAPEHQQTFDEVREDLKKKLQLEKASEEVRNIYDTVEDARAQQTPFEDIAKSANLQFISVPAIDATGKDKDGKAATIPHADEIVKLAFQSDVGAENDAFQSDPDGYIWYEVREIVPSQVRPLDTVKEQVKTDLIAQRVRELAIDKARKLVERATAGTSFDELAKEASAEIRTAQGMKRSESSPDFDNAAVAALFSTPENGFTFAPEASGDGAKVIQSQAVLAPPFDPNSAEANQVKQGLAQAAGADLLGTYLASLQNQVGITVDETLWRQITGAPQQ